MANNDSINIGSIEKAIIRGTLDREDDTIKTIDTITVTKP